MSLLVLLSLAFAQPVYEEQGPQLPPEPDLSVLAEKIEELAEQLDDLAEELEDERCPDLDPCPEPDESAVEDTGTVTKEHPEEEPTDGDPSNN